MIHGVISAGEQRGWHENLVQTIPPRLRCGATHVRNGSKNGRQTIGRWLRAAAQHAEQITEALVRDLHLTVVEVDAFWSFVKKSVPSQATRLRRGERAGAA
jgi:hypothetical protein